MCKAVRWSSESSVREAVLCEASKAKGLSEAAFFEAAVLKVSSSKLLSSKLLCSKLLSSKLVSSKLLLEKVLSSKLLSLKLPFWSSLLRSCCRRKLPVWSSLLPSCFLRSCLAEGLFCQAAVLEAVLLKVSSVKLLSLKLPFWRSLVPSSCLGRCLVKGHFFQAALVEGAVLKVSSSKLLSGKLVVDSASEAVCQAASCVLLAFCCWSCWQKVLSIDLSKLNLHLEVEAVGELLNGFATLSLKLLSRSSPEAPSSSRRWLWKVLVEVGS